jgi:Tol biopolymer transport system component/DNA-binding winged helix-turn-helix (wHTH) protein
MDDPDRHGYEFGEFRLDVRKRALTRRGEAVSVSARNFDLLLFMVENGGRVLEHDELLDKVWVGTFVEQATLQKGVSALRQIFAENPETEYIKTIPRRGYSFVSPVRGLRGDRTDYFVRETERSVTVEELVETDDEVLSPATQVREITAGRARFARLRRYKFPLIGAAIVLLGLIAYGVWYSAFKTRSGFQVENVKIVRLTTRGDLNGAVISPDGKYVAYATSENSGASLWVQQIASGTASRLTPVMTASFWFYTFGPDSTQVYYTVNNVPDASQNGSFKISILGGTPERVSEEPIAFMFSPDGERIVFTRSTNGQLQIVTARPDFSEQRSITAFGDEIRLWNMNWSPDGRTVLCALRKQTPDRIVHYVVAVPVDGSPSQIIVPEMEKQITSAYWLPDMKSLLVCLREVNAETRQLWQYFPANKEFRRVTNDNNSYKGLTLSQDGRSVITLTENFFGSIWVAEGEKYDFQPIASGTMDFDKVGWTADGRMVYSATENGAETIAVVNADSTPGRKLTTGNDGVRLYPRVSADGRSVLFASSRSGVRQLWRTDLEGRNFVQVTHALDMQIFDGKLLSDDQTVVFLGEQPGGISRLYRQARDGTVTPLGEESVDRWDISPDEKFVAYSTTDKLTQKTQIVVRSLADRSVAKTFDLQPFSQLRWTRDNTALTFDAVNGAARELFLQPITGGVPKLLARFPAEQIISFDWSFNGKRLAIVRGKQLRDAVLINLAPKTN